jgi:hypothetical protein
MSRPIQGATVITLAVVGIYLLLPRSGPNQALVNYVLCGLVAFAWLSVLLINVAGLPKGFVGILFIALVAVATTLIAVTTWSKRPDDHLVAAFFPVAAWLLTIFAFVRWIRKNNQDA